MKKLLFVSILAIFLVILPAFLASPAQALDRPELVSPIGSASGDSVLFEWDYSGDVDEFRLEVWQGSDLIFKEYLDENICDEGSADYGIEIDVGPGSNEVNLAPGYEYDWKVRAYKDSTSSSWSYSESFWYEFLYFSPGIMISPVSGDIGTSVTIHGYGWEDNENVEIYVEREKVKTLRRVDTDWSTKVTIKDYGSQSIRVLGDESGWSNYCWFLVKGPDVEISSSSSGIVGSIIKVSGKNWPRSETISLSFANRYVGSVSSGSGNWQDSFQCPELPAGQWAIEAYSRSASAIDYYEIEPSLILSPESTGPGEPVMVKGYGFASSSSVRIALNTATFYSTTNSNGVFSKEIKSPAESGNFIVETRDSRGNTASADLSIGGIINVLPPVLYIGDTLTIRGSSFSDSRDVEITCDGRDLVDTETDRFGNFSIGVNPELKSGKHTIMANDGKVAASATFEVESTPPGIPNPLQPFNGKTLFGSKVNFSWMAVYDPSGVMYEVRVTTDANFEDIVGLATVSKDSASLVVPGQGEYYWQVRAIDRAENTSNWSSVNSFSVNSTWGIVIWVFIALGIVGIGIGTYFWFRKKK